MVVEFPDQFLKVVFVFNRSGIWKILGDFLDFLSAVDFERTYFVFYGLDFKIKFLFLFLLRSLRAILATLSQSLRG